MIGADQRVTPLEALKAMTINVAMQYGEQDSKGSLAVGKRRPDDPGAVPCAHAMGRAAFQECKRLP